MLVVPAVDERDRQSDTSPPDLKILIASTPKTGNTWLRHLLAAIYDLPTVNLGFPFDPEAASAFGALVRSAIQTFFKELLAISVAWKSTGAAHVVEYEALHFDPLQALTTLTSAIHPVSRDSIERAIERCDIREMRAMAYENRGFFRQGGTGGWRQVLPADIIDLLRTSEPYPAQFATLGYTLDAQDKWYTSRIPAHGASRLEKGSLCCEVRCCIFRSSRRSNACWAARWRARWSAALSPARRWPRRSRTS
jgi:hypothetical protein